MESIFFIGLGKLGLIFSHILAGHGFNIYGYDKNTKIKDQIKNNNKSIEPKLNYLIKKNSKNFTFENNFQNAIKNTKYAFLVLPTPSKKNYEFSNAYILEALKNIGPHLKNKSKYIINITSTVNPGSCNLFIEYLEKKFLLKHGREFIVTYNPHLIALGSIYENVVNSDLVIIGSDINYGHKALKKIYNRIYKKNLERLKFLNLKESEISKIAINSYVTLKISFSNTLSEISDNQNNINISKVIKTLGSDKRIGQKYLSLGGSYSGPCFPRDSLNFAHYLKKIKASNYIPLAVEKINKIQIRRYINCYRENTKLLKKKHTIGICGIAYKKNTSIVNFSPGKQIMDYFKKRNHLIIFDEYKPDIKEKIDFYDDIKKFFKKADVIFVCYVNEKFKELEKLKTKRSKTIIDLWNFLNIKEKKIKYKSLGVSS
jgi:UDPglucose 6-dehydrogenase